MSPLTPLGRTTIIVSWTITTLALTALALGTAGRLHARKTIAAIEYLNCVAFVIGVILVAQNTFTIVVEGQAEHQSRLKDSQINTLSKSILIHEGLWLIANALIRISACLSIATIWSHIKSLRIIMRLTIGLCALHALAGILDLSLICRPISAQWKAEVNAICGDQRLSFILLESTAIALDTVILVVPIFGVSMIKIARKSRMVLYLVFELGAILFIIAGLRLKAISYATSPDFIYSKSYLGLLSALGVMLSIIICVAPQYRLISTLLRSLVPRHVLSFNARGTTSALVFSSRFSRMQPMFSSRLSRTLPPPTCGEVEEAVLETNGVSVEVEAQTTHSGKDNKLEDPDVREV